MSDDLPYASLLEASRLVHSGQVSPRELTAALLDRIDRLEGSIHAFVTVTRERALLASEQAEREILAGSWRGPLHGIPIALKDVLDTSFAPTTAGMPVFRDRTPSTDATVVRRLEAAGAVIVGKLAMTEGATYTHHPDWPAPRNPWNGDYWPGVSSSGSGVATAAALCYGALASDTGGSIRFPAAACGVTGVKPSWGRVSRHGAFPLAETLDHLGPLARSAADAAIILQAIAGHDPADPTSLTASVPAYSAEIEGGIAGLRIGTDEAALREGVCSEVAEAVLSTVRLLEAAGGTRIAVSLPPLDPLARPFIKICSAEAWLAHRQVYPEHASLYGSELAALIAHGEAQTGPSVAEAHIERRKWTGLVAHLFGTIDLLVLPVLPMTVPRTTAMPSILADRSTGVARFTLPFSLSGSPVVVVPAGFDRNGMPIGVQLVGNHLSEGLLLRAAHVLQQRTDWHLRRPNLSGSDQE